MRVRNTKILGNSSRLPPPTNICTHTHTYMYLCMYTNIHTHMQTYIHTNIHTHTHTCIHTYHHSHTHIHTFTYIHFTYIHTYIYKRTQTLKGKVPRSLAISQVHMNLTLKTNHFPLPHIRVPYSLAKKISANLFDCETSARRLRKQSYNLFLQHSPLHIPSRSPTEPIHASMHHLQSMPIV